MIEIPELRTERLTLGGFRAEVGRFSRGSWAQPWRERWGCGARSLIGGCIRGGRRESGMPLAGARGMHP